MLVGLGAVGWIMSCAVGWIMSWFMAAPPKEASESKVIASPASPPEVLGKLVAPPTRVAVPEEKKAEPSQETKQGAEVPSRAPRAAPPSAVPQAALASETCALARRAHADNSTDPGRQRSIWDRFEQAFAQMSPAERALIDMARLAQARQDWPYEERHAKALSEMNSAFDRFLDACATRAGENASIKK